MDRARFVRVQEAVVQALELHEDARADFLRGLEARDGALHAEVMRLLARGPKADDAMVPPIEAMMGPVLLGPEDDDPLVGRSLGAFTLEALIGVGGMGRVYRARQKDPDRLVAVKVLGSRLLGRAAVKRFRQEAAVLGRLEHPGICRVYDAQTALLGVDSVPFIAMELVEGPTLMEAMTGAGVEDKLRVFAAICDAAEYAHQKAVIHRDLKPANIVVINDAGTGERRPKVLDFGIARVVEPMMTGAGANSDAAGRTASHDATITEATTMVGTVEYMSPEQLRGLVADIDTRTDVYALGLMLFELLSGVRAFKSPSSWAAAIDRLSDDMPPRLRAAAPGLAAELDAIVSRATAPERERRYQAVADLADDVRRFLTHRPIRAKAPTWAYIARKFVLRNTGLSAAVAVAVIAIVAAVVGIGVSLGQAVRQRDQATLSAARSRANEYVASVQAAAAAIRANDVVTATARLNAAPQEHRGWEWRFLRGQLDQSARSFEATTGENAPIWRVLPSDDGTRVVAMGDRWIGVYDSTSGRLLKSREFEGRGTMSMQWMDRESRILVSTGWGRHLAVLDSQTLEFVRESELLESEACAAQISPDGSVLALAVGRPMSSAPADRRVMLLDAASWEPIGQLELEEFRADELRFSPDGRWLMALGNGRCRVWEMRDQRAVWSGSAPIHAATWAMNGVGLVTAGDDGVIMWRAGGWERMAVLGSVINRAAGATASKDGRHFAIADGSLVRVWNVERGQEIATWRGHSSRVRCVAALPSNTDPTGTTFVSGATEHEIKVWTGTKASEVETIEAYADLSASSDHTLIAHQARDDASRVVVRQSPEFNITSELRAQTLVEAGSTLTFSTDGSMLARLRGGVMTRWSLRNEPSHEERVLAARGEMMPGLWACADGSWVCISTPDATTGRYSIRLIDRDLKDVRAVTRALTADPTTARFAGRPLAFATNRGGDVGIVIEGTTATMLELPSLATRGQFSVDSLPGFAALSDDGLRMAFIDDSKQRLAMYRTRDGAREGVWQPVASAERVLFDPAGDRLFVSLQDGSVRVVAMIAQPGGALPVLAEVAQLNGGVSWMMNLSVSADGSSLLAGSAWPARTAYLLRCKSASRP